MRNSFKSDCKFVQYLLSAALLALVSSNVHAQDFRPGKSAYQNGRAAGSKSCISEFVPQNGNTSLPARSRTNSFQSSSQTMTAQQQLGQNSSSDVAYIDTCTVEYVDEVDLPALETGALSEVMVREGDLVPKGKIIARIDPTLLQHQLRQALVRKANAERVASDTTSIEAAEKQIQLTRHIYETTRKLYRTGARSAEEKDRARYEYEVAVLQRRAAVVRQLEAKGEAEVEYARASEVEERIRRHDVAATFDSVVVKRHKQQGEWVTAGEPVAMVARMDKLYVKALIPNQQYNPADVDGKDVVVTVKLARNETLEIPGRIVVIGSSDISASKKNQFPVKAEISNKMKDGQWVLRKHASVSMKIMLK